MTKVVLFDIDGTLLTTGGAARQAFTRALSEAAGRPIDPDGYSFSGKTDPQIARDVLARHGIAGEALEACVPEAVSLYVRHFAAMVPRLSSARLLPGVRPLLDALASPEREAFAADYAARMAAAYPRRPDGRTLFPFRRLFILAAR